MEQDNKQHTLTFNRGICNASPDQVCNDNELEDCIGLTYHDDALRPVQAPAKFIELPDQYKKYRLVYVHLLDGSTNYIFEYEDGLYFYNSDGVMYKIPDVTEKDVQDDDLEIVGREKVYVRWKIINDGASLFIKPDKIGEDTDLYFRYKPIDSSFTFSAMLEEGGITINRRFSVDENGLAEYVGLKPSFDAKYQYELLRDDNLVANSRPSRLPSSTGETEVTHGGYVAGITSIDNTLIVSYSDTLGYYLWDVASRYYKLLGDKIPSPRVTLSLHGPHEFDGYSTPDFLTEYVEQNYRDDNAIFAVYNKLKKRVEEENGFHSPFFIRYAVHTKDGEYTNFSAPILMLPSVEGNIFYDTTFEQVQAYMPVSKIFYNLFTDYKDWADIVSDISVFVTRPVEVYKDKLRELADGQSIEFVWQSITVVSKGSRFYIEHRGYDSRMQKRDDRDILSDLVDSTVFYKVGEIDIAFEDSGDMIRDKGDLYLYGGEELYIKEGTIANLETQHSLKSDDFFSNSEMFSDTLDSFNGRLNLVGLKRGLFPGYAQFFPYSGKNATNTPNNLPVYPLYKYRSYVWVRCNDEIKVIRKEWTTSEAVSAWFYYPDSRAFQFSLYIYKNNKWYQLFDKQELVESKGINGVYYFAGFEDVFTFSEGTETTESKMPEVSNNYESIGNYIIQSNVGNPLVFDATSYIKVGKGTIIGISALTTALSNDAYKVASVIVFTTQGVWALKVSDEGDYSVVPPPFSREVCSNKNSITMIDRGVFFISKKGLMLISDDGIRCLSGLVAGKKNGKDFIKFVQSCKCAYDYINNQLFLINNEKEGSGYIYDYYWVYNISTNTFATVKITNRIISIVGNYPDTLFQCSDSNIYSVLNEPNINEDTTRYNGSFTTRPLKLDGALTLKSIRQMEHIMDLNSQAQFSVTIEASNDCKTWKTVPSLKGSPYKFFRLKYDLKNLLASDSFSGTVLRTQTRYPEHI